jgi:hypothetical protein
LEHEKSLAKAKISGLVLNIIIGLQIILGALTTALSAVATTGSKVSPVNKQFMEADLMEYPVTPDRSSNNGPW